MINIKLPGQHRVFQTTMLNDTGSDVLTFLPRSPCSGVYMKHRTVGLYNYRNRRFAHYKRRKIIVVEVQIVPFTGTLKYACLGAVFEGFCILTQPWDSHVSQTLSVSRTKKTGLMSEVRGSWNPLRQLYAVKLFLLWIL